MAWNGKHPLESASRSLLENFEFFAYACLWVQYSIERGASLCLNHCNRFTQYWASLAEERRKKKEDGRFCRLANCRFGTPVMVSMSANSLFADEHTREWLVWCIKAYDYVQSRVLNIRFCTRLMGPPFFFWVIPTYRQPRVSRWAFSGQSSEPGVKQPARLSKKRRKPKRRTHSTPSRPSSNVQLYTWIYSSGTI